MSEGFWFCFFSALLLCFLIGCFQAIQKVTKK